MKRPHFGALHMDLTTSVGSERKQLSSDKDRKIHMCIYINYQKKKNQIIGLRGNQKQDLYIYIGRFTFSSCIFEF